MALLLAALALGLPFIMNGPVNDEDILTPLPTPESTVTTITEDSKITAVPYAEACSSNYEKAYRCISETVCCHKQGGNALSPCGCSQRRNGKKRAG